MKTNTRQSNLYKTFCEAEGSQNIASEYAIEKINEVVEKFGLYTILEIGLGIGSISGMLLAAKKNNLIVNYSGTESNKFCLNAIAGNLRENYYRLSIYPNLTEIPPERKFNLIIIDGMDRDLHTIKNMISENGILVIEGDRVVQQYLLQELFPFHKYVHCISLKKNKEYSPFPIENWQGGVKFIFVDPTMKQKFWWLKEIFLTKIKYQFPGRYLGQK
jgi:hypothetical protein